MAISILVAAAENGVIGHGGDLPWHLPADLARFKALTMGHALIVGRKTFESIGRPLPGRRTIVLSRQLESVPDGVLLARSPEEAVRLAGSDDEIFVAGGGEIYELFLSRASRVYLTRVHASVAGDAHFPALDADVWMEVSREDHDADERHRYPYSYLVFERRLS